MKHTQRNSTDTVHDCRNCEYGKFNDHWNNYFCYSEEPCNQWDKYQPKNKNANEFTKEEDVQC